MQGPAMLAPRAVAPDTVMLPSYMPVPGFGVLPVNAFVIRGREPVLIDTGLAALRDDFVAALGRSIDPEDLRWIWLTHADADHLGNLAAVLELAPRARVVTTYLGMGKLGLMGMPVDRAFLLNPGQSLDLGDRRLEALAPPCFDAPETTVAFDARTRALFSSDCFGALMDRPAETAAALPEADLVRGMVAWATVDAPWLPMVDRGTFAHALGRVRDLDPATVLGSHLPPADGMTGTLLGVLAGAPDAPAFVGPDQAALERMMAQAA